MHSERVLYFSFASLRITPLRPFLGCNLLLAKSLFQTIGFIFEINDVFHVGLFRSGISFILFNRLGRRGHRFLNWSFSALGLVFSLNWRLTNFARRFFVWNGTNFFLRDRPILGLASARHLRPLNVKQILEWWLACNFLLNHTLLLLHSELL